MTAPIPLEAETTHEGKFEGQGFPLLAARHRVGEKWGRAREEQGEDAAGGRLEEEVGELRERPPASEIRGRCW